jgi:hypothetical protein
MLLPLGLLVEVVAEVEVEVLVLAVGAALGPLLVVELMVVPVEEELLG